MGSSGDDRLLVLCETAELAVACLAAAAPLELPLSSEVPNQLWLRAQETAAGGVALGVACQSVPAIEDLVGLAEAARRGAARVVVGMLGPADQTGDAIAVAGDLGLTAVFEIDPLVTALALIRAGAAPPFALGTRRLSGLDRARLGPVLGGLGATDGELRSLDGAALGLETGGRTDKLGTAPNVAQALLALQRTEQSPQEVTSEVDGVDGAAVGDVLFGPRRALSDPASKQVLEHYGLPMPDEELCSSASRAAAEASRIGYPVRISLASPDLRIWDHPELVVDMVDSAAQVRGTFRDLMQLAASQPGKPRLLGVTVTATSEASALLFARATPLAHGRVLTRLGFADPHGWAARDVTMVLLPAPTRRIERAVGRLAGAALLRSGSQQQRQRRIVNLADVLLRLAAAINDRAGEIDAIELRPLAMRPDGSFEVREACVSVSDRFERTLAGP